MTQSTDSENKYITDLLVELKSELDKIASDISITKADVSDIKIKVSQIDIEK